MRDERTPKDFCGVAINCAALPSSNEFRFSTREEIKIEPRTRWRGLIDEKEK